MLDGVRVAEMGLWVAGPAAGGVLADWGADVVKIEPPSGDPMRTLFRALSGSNEQRCPPFDLYNRGKRSVAVDVNTPEGRELAERIVAGSDVFLTNMRPAFLERVGLDPVTLRAKYPRLVYASLTGYGLAGPDRDAPGFDVAAFSARGGVADRSTPPGDAPTTLAGGMGDAVTGLTTVAAVLAALLHRERTGEGQLVGTSLLRSGAYCIGMELSTRLALGKLAPPPSRVTPQNPLMNSYRAADGWFWLMGAEADRHWPGIRDAADDERLHDDRFATARDRRRGARELVAILDEVFARRTRDDWADRFEQHDVWWTPVNTAAELLTDPQALAAGILVDVPGPGSGSDEPVRSINTPARFDAEIAPVSGAPLLGADTDAVLGDLGVDAGTLERLHAEGVLLGPDRA